MKVATINFSGNNGKTTLAEHVFAARMPGALQLTIETINAGNEDIEKVRGKDFGQMMEAVMLADQAIVDVGASNVEDTMKLMKQYSGSHEEFDYFVVPAVKESKQLEDTLATIQALSSLAFLPKRLELCLTRSKLMMMLNQTFILCSQCIRQRKTLRLTRLPLCIRLIFTNSSAHLKRASLICWKILRTGVKS
uniref:Stability protein StdB n=1 Tax=Enterobacter sp. HP19 TaxID=1811975 RepID=A0A2H4UEA3_9ENTR|nr:Stability protein StdB [Enterobacter sp. HP19]